MSSLRTNLSFFWALEQASGTRYDSVGSNHLTDNNTVTSNPGLIGTAAQFTRPNSEWLSVPHNATQVFGDVDLTVACWMYFDTYVGATEFYCAVGKDDGGTGRAFYLCGNDAALSRFTFRCFRSGGNVTCPANTFGAPTTATWYWALGQYVSATQTVGIQINNGTLDTAALGGALNAVSSGDLTIGRRENSSDFGYFNGRIDQVGIWVGRILTSSEKSFMFNGGTPLSFEQMIQQRLVNSGLRQRKFGPGLAR